MVSSLLLSSSVLLLALALVPLRGSLGRLHHYSMSNIVYRHVVHVVFGIRYVLPLTWPFIKKEIACGHIHCAIDLILGALGFRTYVPIIVIGILNVAIITVLLLTFHSKWYLSALISIPIISSIILLSFYITVWMTRVMHMYNKLHQKELVNTRVTLSHLVTKMHQEMVANQHGLADVITNVSLLAQIGLGERIVQMKTEMIQHFYTMTAPQLDFCKSVEKIIRELLEFSKGFQGMMVEKVDHIIIQVDLLRMGLHDFHTKLDALSANFGEVKDLISLESATIQEAIDLTRPAPDSSINPNDPMTTWIMILDEHVSNLTKNLNNVLEEVTVTRNVSLEAIRELRWDLNSNLDKDGAEWHNKGADIRSLTGLLKDFVNKTNNYRSNLQAHILSIEDSNKKLGEQQDSLMKVSFRGGKTSEELLQDVLRNLNHHATTIRGRIEVVGEEVKDLVHKRTATLNWDRESPTWIKQERSSSLELDTGEIAEVPSSPVEEDDELIVVKLESPPPPDLSGGFARRTPSSSLSSLSD
ncbi:hypothetical protein FRC02_007258 [Tulasnella sp. 418]|nr:hypothetical protein FRC02_007258 [Tulasnella sp. 418]